MIAKLNDRTNWKYCQGGEWDRAGTAPAPARAAAAGQRPRLGRSPASVLRDRLPGNRSRFRPTCRGRPLLERERLDVVEHDLLVQVSEAVDLAHEPLAVDQE